MNTVIAEFCHRVEGIQFHGLGLSADAYQPDFFELMARLEHDGCAPDFVELFRAGTPMLAAIRRRYPGLPMPYHAEGLWLTQPGWLVGPEVPPDLQLAAEQVKTLESAWLNHECASKVVDGYPFGTYLPPLFTGAVAGLVADQAGRAQAVLDRLAGGAPDPKPFLLLELPPLTYFGIGPLAVAAFFRQIADAAPCGFVLDIGHLWTHYRYGRRQPGESLDRFVGRFLDEFPTERVVEIHVAGLAPHPAGGDDVEGAEPEWLDAHGVRIPAVLFEILDQVLTRSPLGALKGIALEVDTKPVELIAEEFAEFRRRYMPMLAKWNVPHTPLPCKERAFVDAVAPSAGSGSAGRRWSDHDYLNAILGRARAEPVWDLDDASSRGLTRYREGYLSHELLHWGGDIAEMFPQTCAELARRGVNVDAFPSFWFAARRPVPTPFDFFLLKIQWFVEFVGEQAPDVRALAEREAGDLRAAYDEANAPPPVAREGRT